MKPFMRWRETPPAAEHAVVAPAWSATLSRSNPSGDVTAERTCPPCRRGPVEDRRCGAATAEVEVVGILGGLVSLDVKALIAARVSGVSSYRRVSIRIRGLATPPLGGVGRFPQRGDGDG